MLSFKPVELSDKDVIEPLLRQSDYQSCEYVFSNMFIWRNHYNTHFAIHNECLFLRNTLNDVQCYGFPAGAGDKKAALRVILAHAKDENFMLGWVTAEQKTWLEAEFPGQFTFAPDRSVCEYIYYSKDLIELSGRKYHSKRNHIAGFLRDCGAQARYEHITPETIGECKTAYEQWRAERDGNFDDEQAALFAALDNFETLGLCGGMIKCPEGVCGFSAGRPLNSDTFDIHIEKALGGHSGIYAVLNNWFARDFCAGYTYINREDDMGLEGLRKAKESYFPDLLLEKTVAEEEKI